MTCTCKEGESCPQCRQTGGAKARVFKKGQMFKGKKILSLKKTKNGATLAKLSGKKGSVVYRFVKGSSDKYLKKIRSKARRSRSKSRSRR